MHAAFTVPVSFTDGVYAVRFQGYDWMPVSYEHLIRLAGVWGMTVVSTPQGMYLEPTSMFRRTSSERIALWNTEA